MKRVIKNIVLIHMLIAGLVIFFHSVILKEHHHNIFCDATFEHQQSDQASGNPHCHFFINLVPDKLTSNFNSNSLKHIPINDVLLLDEKNIEINKYSFWLSFSTKKEFSVYSILLINSPTRGSPC